MKCISKLDSEEELLRHDNLRVTDLKNANTACRVVRFGKASVAVKLLDEHSKRNLAVKKAASKPWFFTHV